MAGALIGLLFVAMSVSADRLARVESASQASRVRADAALIAFTNSLSVSLFALLPGEKIGYTAAIVGFLGILFVAGSVISLVRVRHKHLTVRDGALVLGLVVVFALQLISGVQVMQRPGFAEGVETIAILVICCFLVGISRAWELIGGPSIGFSHEVVSIVRGREAGQPTAGPTAEPAAEPAAGEEPPLADPRP